MSAAATWRSVALGMALDGQFDVRRQQRGLAQLLEQGRDCTPAEVVAALQREHPPAAPPIVHRGQQRLTALGGRFIVIGDDEYPMPLRTAWPQLGAPLWLFVRGTSVELADIPVVAVIGTRTPTLDGLRTAGMVAGALARAGAVVVSGMARGIDQRAPRAALDAGGRTIAVLASGVLNVFPQEHVKLAEEVAAHGAVVSEAAPTMPPVAKSSMPARWATIMVPATVVAPSSPRATTRDKLRRLQRWMLPGGRVPTYCNCASASPT